MTNYRKIEILIILFLLGVGSYFLRLEPFDFKTVNGSDVEVAAFQRFDRNYYLEKISNQGSGQYTDFTLYRIKDDSTQEKIVSFSTCGRIADKGNQILFYIPKGFHCGLWTSYFDNYFNSEISKVEFFESGENVINHSSPDIKD